MNKLTIQDTKKILNFLDIRKDEPEDERIMELIVYAVKLLYKKEFHEIEANKRDKIMKDTLKEIDRAIAKYLKIQDSKKNNDFVYITINNKEYQSKPLNIKLFYEINDMMLAGEDVFKISEYILKKLFSGIISIEKIEDVKENDYISYEIIIDDVSSLIYKTIEEAMKITKVKNPLKDERQKFYGKINEISMKIDEKLETYESDIYSIMLENYNKMPSEVDSESAITILKLINSLKTNQIKREIKEEIDKIKKNSELSQETKIEVLEQYLIQLGGDD